MSVALLKAAMNGRRRLEAIGVVWQNVSENKRD